MAKGSGNSGTLWFTTSLTDGSDSCMSVLFTCLQCDVRCACSNCKKNYLGYDTVKARIKGDMN